MKFELYFTDDEICDFLSKEGYKIEIIKTWKPLNSYHNLVGESIQEVKIAYTDKFNEFSRVDGIYRDETISNYKIQKVFGDVFKNKLLKL